MRTPTIHEFETELDDGREVTIHFTYSPYRPGRMYTKGGDPGDPPEGPEAEIQKVTDEDGLDIYESLEDEEIDALTERIYEDWDPE